MSFMKVALLPVLLAGSLVAQPARAGGVDEIIKAGVLRVCTPGDYKPFAFARPDGTYEGIDVDLMQSLATSLGVKVEWVKTTWANMMADFTGNKCDIAVGGISVTLDRQKRVAFSTPYMVNGGARAGALRGRAEVTRPVAVFDKAGVKVIANPGGSNERFAKGELQAGRADDPQRQHRHLRRGTQGQCRCVRDRIGGGHRAATPETRPVRGQSRQAAAIRRDGLHAAAR